MLLANPLDWTSEAAAEAARPYLEKIQGNILRPRRRKHARLLILRFADPPYQTSSQPLRHRAGPGASGPSRPEREPLDPSRRKAIAEVLQGIAVCNAAENTPEAGTGPAESVSAEKAPPQSDAPTSEFVTVLLSFSGYQALGLKSFAPSNRFFRQGMIRGNFWVAPPDTKGWDAAYKDHVDAVIVLASNEESPHALKDRADRLLREFQSLGVQTHVEAGQRITRWSKDVEPFGFRDGISQPVFFRTQQNSTAGARWNAETPLSAVLTPDPGEDNAYGSFMVFRKLEQNLRKFHSDVRKLRRVLGPPAGTQAEDSDRAYALTLGRYPDGRPLVDPAGDLRDFDFSRSANGGEACPFHAHIRKMNPRGGSHDDSELAKQEETKLRIARRGIPYGASRYFDPDSEAKLPEERVGLLFMSFQSDIVQFLFHEWASQAPHFPQSGSGVDAITGWARNGYQQRPSGTGTVKHVLANNVKLKGGEYFFAPSIPVLKKLVRLVEGSS